MEITTKRLLLRPFKASDLPHLKRYVLREEFYRFLPMPEPDEEYVENWLQEKIYEAKNPTPHRYVCAIELKKAGHPIGCVRLDIFHPHHGTADLGFSLDYDHQGEGYIIEALAAWFRFAFEDLKLHRVGAVCDTHDVATYKTLEVVGMLREGILRENLCIRGERRDSFFYSILATENKHANRPSFEPRLVQA